MALADASPLLYNQVLHIPSTDGVANVHLPSGIAQQVAIPSGARAASFAFDADIWVTYGASTAGAIHPSSYTSAGSTASAEFNPTIRYFASTAGTTAINVYSQLTCKGTISFYK